MSGRKKPDFIKKHEYPGGKKAFREFIQQQLVYPPEALQHKISGEVFLEYTVGFDGKVNKVDVKKGLGYGCDEEAVRLIRLLQFAPQNNHGVKVMSTHKIRIKFHLPPEAEPPKQVQLQYELKKAQKEPVKNKDNKPGSYSYTIKL